MSAASGATTDMVLAHHGGIACGSEALDREMLDYVQSEFFDTEDKMTACCEGLDLLPQQIRQRLIEGFDHIKGDFEGAPQSRNRVITLNTPDSDDSFSFTIPA